ncbi:hypothetical protein BCR44DRAFT_1102919 [Catenaria anguillulae PL171]|uniref:Galactose oxidase n=1 Tax=Catenaria anguillulae PL171 TaxID=765915 RepID=A0A1Y2I240_9FUNG|nr:hypothetical protein BCR44DRAFT_1102919 [Catenaria anguillulae PL171]
MVALAITSSSLGQQEAHPGNRTNVAHAIIDRTLYVFGGIRPNYVVLGDLWAFNMATRTWTRIETSGTQPGALQHATMVANGTASLIVFGGTDARGVHSNGLFSLDLQTRTWTQHQPLTTRLGAPARLPALERVRGVKIDARRVLFAGGIGPDGSTNATYAWKLDENVWSRSAYTDMPSALHSHALVS